MKGKEAEKEKEMGQGCDGAIARGGFYERQLKKDVLKSPGTILSSSPEDTRQRTDKNQLSVFGWWVLLKSSHMLELAFCRTTLSNLFSSINYLSEAGFGLYRMKY